MLLDTAKELQDKLPQLLFVLIGEGAEKEHVKERIIKENILNIKLFPFQPYEDIAHVFSLGDVGLIISKPGVGTNSVPSKTWSYMAAAKPILTSFDEDSELCHLIEKVQCGLISSPLNKENFIDSIYSQINEKQLIDIGLKGKNYIKINLDKDKQLKEYQCLIGQFRK